MTIQERAALNEFIAGEIVKPDYPKGDVESDSLMEHVRETWKAEELRKAESDAAKLDKALGWTDTPLTDGFAKQVHEGQCLPTCDSYAHDDKCPVCNGEGLLADFARNLERTLNAAISKIAQLETELNRAKTINHSCHLERALNLDAIKSAKEEIERLKKSLL